MTNDILDKASGATPELRRLGVFEGRWKTNGRVMSTPTEAEMTIEGTDEYEWLPGGHFMAHRVDVVIGSRRVRTLEIIGHAPEAQVYPTRFFDHQGNSGTYEGTVSDGVWTFTAEGARAILEVEPSRRRMEAMWERSNDDGTWTPWMELQFTKLP